MIEIGPAVLSSAPRRTAVLRVAALLGLALILALLWEFTPIKAIGTGDNLQDFLTEASASPAAPFAAILIFAIAGVVVFPMSILVIATSATFGAAFGFTYSFIGAALGATLGYLCGRWLGRNGLKRLVGTRVNRFARKLARQGILPVAAIRLLPFAPFAVMNLVAGAIRVRYPDYILGSMLGKLPGMLVQSVLGKGALDLVIHPTPLRAGLFVLYLAAWAGITWLVHLLVERLKRRVPKGPIIPGMEAEVLRADLARRRGSPI
jgi:uncharacterized membrane protein YdjX (TVP38/TMEM64 family)